MAEQITRDVVKEAQSMGGPSPIDTTATSPTNSAGDGEAHSAPPNPKPTPSETTSTNATSTDGGPVTETRPSDKTGGDGVAGPATSSDNPSGVQSGMETKELLVNGDSGEHSASEDISSQRALGEASGGSDTDISRPSSVDQAKDRTTRHLRSNSLKKPASFKSVSVTKNFLAKSAVSTPSARPGEKASPAGQTSASTQQTAKPRLVAKSGSGIGNVPRSSLSKINGAGSGPDASKVWNKNQPVPPQPPKQFTDEELKQQYGIHLATRLQADESGKEAKWADIDDDEDDWAPDTVQWMDGTKSTVAAAVENQPPPPEEPKPASKREPLSEVTKPLQTSSTNVQRPSSTSGTKTILKPGAHMQKGQPEKPTLVAKPSTSGPSKSPWAPLPPVDRVSPVQINPPVQPSGSLRYSQRDSHGYDAMPPPTKEIAPDDFNRSWRDDRGNRELFNSHSGRYEPVNEMRRGSVRDNNLRQQPSVLQRPSHDGPAEPSAAFQTSRTSGDVPTWGRRRNSSNVSGGSGGRLPTDRRVPDLPPMPLNIQRRGSHSVNGVEAPSPGTPRAAFPHKGPYGDPHHPGLEQHPPSWVQKPSPNLSNVQPASPYGSVTSAGPQEVVPPAVTVPIECAVEVQNRLMREKLERARLQKQKERELEEQEEAERKERLRKKLEAMGMGNDPKPKSKSKEPSPSRPDAKSPQKERAVPAPVQSPPKPPVPTSEGEVAQYGMMKVHQAHPVKKPYSDAVPPKSMRGVELAPKASSSPVKSHAEVQPAPGPAPSLTEGPAQPPPTFTPDTRTNRSPSEHAQGPVQHAEGNARSNNQGLKQTQAPPAAWAQNPLPPQAPRPWGSNVWGPPQTKERALGNGTFDSSYNRGQPRSGPSQLPPQTQPGQAPPLGLNPPLNPSAAPPQGPLNQSFAQQTIYAQGENMPAPQLSSTMPKPGPIAPPPSIEKSGWGNFAAVIRLDDQNTVLKARQDLERLGGETFRPEMRETYTDRKGQSQKTVHAKVVGNVGLVNGVKPESAQGPTAELKPKDEATKPAYASAASANEGPAAQPAVGQGPHLQPTGQATRSSRFFPKTSEATAQPSVAPAKSDSAPPPPPETQSHPAFMTESQPPIVKLPNPPPRVRLPPPATEVAVQAVQPEPRLARTPLGARPLALDPEWQARFNSLLDKPTPAPIPAAVPKPSYAAPSVPSVRTGALAIAASSKAPLEVRENVTSATVSLPLTVGRKPFVDDDGSDITTRSSAEEILLEEREFGSLPVVRAPKVPHLAAAEAPVGFPATRPHTRFPRPLDVITKSVYHVMDYDRNAENIEVKVRLANMSTAITKTMARKRENRENRRGPGHKGPKRNFTASVGGANANQNQRPRKTSNYQGQGGSSNNSPRSATGNGWSSSRSAPPQSNSNNSTWARRAAPVH